jgi:hypothetical protein
VKAEEEEAAMTTSISAAQIAGLYRASTTPRLLTIPTLRFLMIDGRGDPETSVAYRGAVQALYALSYAARFAVKRAGGPVHPVSALEGLWWAEDMTAFATGDRSAWQWTMMIRQPDEVDADLVDTLRDQIVHTKDLPSAAAARLEEFTEGTSAQILHIGPYATEAATIARLHAFIAEQGYRFDEPDFHHHEIYLSDPRRAAPERLRTIIRQPVARA